MKRDILTQEEEQQLNYVFESLQEGMVIQDHDGKIIRFNSAALKILGLSADQLLQRDSLDPRWKAIRFDGSDFPGEEHPAMLALRSGKPVANVNMGITDPKRGLRWIRVNSTPFENQDKINVVTTFRDITDDLSFASEHNAYADGINSTAIVARTDREGKILSVNKAFCDISGYSEQELIGKDHRIINSAHHSKEFFKTMWETILSGRVWTGEIKNRAKNGSFYWVNTIITPIKDHNGNIYEFIAFRYDITEKKEHEIELEKAIEQSNKSLSFLQGIQDNAAHALISTTTDGIITSFNSKAEEILGYKAEELVGKESPAVFHDLDEVVQRSMEFSKNLGETIEPGFETFVCHTNKGLKNNFEWTYVHKNGSRIPVLLSITAIKNKNGEITGYLGIAQDLTDLKKLESKLAETVEYLNLAVEGAGLGIWDWDLRDNGVKFDRRWAEMLGLDINEIAMELNTWESRVHPDDLDQCYADIKAYMDGKTDRYENIHRMKHANGEWVYILDRGRFSLWDDKGNPIRFTGTHLDITDLKKAQELAQQAERAKTEFLANMSHEIRTPMNGITGMIDILQSTKLSDDQKEMLHIIEVSGESLLSLVNDILDISKIESGKLETEKVNYNLNDCLFEATKLLERKAHENNTKIALDFDEKNDHWLKGDVTRVRQILINYISNAIKFTKNGVVTAGFEIKDNKTLIWVKDTGIGISKEDGEKLFQAFVQADTSITRKFGGTGLGLAICSKLASLMGGRVFFESKKNSGSIFYLELPYEKGASDNKEYATDLEISPEFAKKFPHRILLAEDNEVNQKIVTLMLGKLGYECEIAANGVEVLELLEQKPDDYYSLILMDMQMPELDGISTTKKIMEWNKKELPFIVALTANAFISDKEDCLNAGMQDFLTKPLKIEKLAGILSKYQK